MQNKKHYVFLLLCLVASVKPLAAQSETKPGAYSRNADAYSLEFVGFNSQNNDFCACYFMDAIVFTSTREKPWFNKLAENGESYSHIYTTEKNARGKYMKPKLFMGDLTTTYNDGPVCFSADFSTVYFSRLNKKVKRAGDGNYKMNLYMATLNRNGFDSVVVLPFNSNEYNLAHPSLSADGTRLFFTSDMPGGFGGMDIYMSKKENGQWGSPVNLGEKINTASDEVFPFIASDNKLYFSTSGLPGMGGLDIFETTVKNDKATRPFNMGEPVNSNQDDFGLFLGKDNKTGFISSNRKGMETVDDIYELRILRDVKRGKEVTFVAKDKNSGKVLPGTLLLINGDSVLTDSGGSYVKLLEEDVNYTVTAKRNDYFDNEQQLSASASNEDSFTRELILNPDPKLALDAKVKDLKTGILLQGVSLSVTDSVSAKTYTLQFADGDYRTPLNDKAIGDKLVMRIALEKPGYLSKTTTLRHSIDKPGDIPLHELTDLNMGKAEVGTDLAKLIDIKPIYFDLGKSTIRKDAALELDKIVDIMKQYPNMAIELGSHTDCRSAAAANLKLSTARAKASAAYIVKKGIDKSRIVGKGYGESKLLNNCACEGKTVSTCPEEEHTKNRRTEFIITRMQ